MSDYNIRQFNLMLDQLDQFDLGRIDLHHLVVGLESLVALLDGIDIKRKTDIERKWSVLEEVYSDMLYQNIDVMPDTHAKLVKDSVSMLRIMIRVGIEAEESEGH